MKKVKKMFIDMPFTIRKFDNELRLGEKLKSLRKAANITLSELEKKTKIQRQYFRAFESSDFDKLPAPIYARNYLRTFVKVLGADETYFLNLFEQERGTCDFMKKARLPICRTRSIRFLVASKFIKIFCISLVALAIASYIGVQISAIISAPEIVLSTPEDGFTTERASVSVVGTTQPMANVRINGEPVLLLKDGSFEQTIALERGLNVITIEGTKRYSKKITLYRRVVLTQDKTVSIK